MPSNTTIREGFAKDRRRSRSLMALATGGALVVAIVPTWAVVNERNDQRTTGQALYVAGSAIAIAKRQGWSTDTPLQPQRYSVSKEIATGGQTKRYQIDVNTLQAIEDSSKLPAAQIGRVSCAEYFVTDNAVTLESLLQFKKSGDTQWQLSASLPEADHNQVCYDALKAIDS